MKIASTVMLIVLIALAVASGIAKIALTPQEVEFFGRHGLSNAMLIAFGTFQVMGAVLMIFGKTRIAGAAIVAISFLISLVLLLLDGNVPMSIITLIVTLLLGFVMKQNWGTPAVADGRDDA